MKSKHRQRKRFVKFLSAVLMLVAVCSVSAVGQTTLRVTYAPNSLVKIYEAIAEEFQRLHSDIKIELSAQRNYEELAQATLRGSLIGDLPDVSHQGTKLVPFLVKNDIAVPLNSFIESEAGWKKQGSVPSMIKRCSYGGKINCIPFSLSPYVLYFNADLVRKVGGDPGNFPSDWDGIFELASRISKLDDRFMGIYHDYRGDLAFQTLVMSRGGQLLKDDESSVAFDGPDGLWALNLMRKAANAGMKDIGRNQAFQAFVAGQVGIVASSVSRLGQFTMQSKGVFDLGVALYPMSASATQQPAGGNIVMMTTRNQAARQAAWKYIKFATGAVGQAIMVKKSGYVPVNTVAINTPDLLGNYYAADPRRGVAVSRLAMIIPMYAIKNKNGIKIIDEIEKTMGAMARGKGTPENALSSLVKITNAWLAR